VLAARRVEVIGAKRAMCERVVRQHVVADERCVTVELVRQSKKAKAGVRADLDYAARTNGQDCGSEQPVVLARPEGPQQSHPQGAATNPSALASPSLANGNHHV
jgi:hypothetical protein